LSRFLIPTANARYEAHLCAYSDNDLQAPVKLFGRDMTKQGALMLILNDQHEHLGHTIAYARSKSVVPSWSK